MGDALDALKAELERFGEANDAVNTERPRLMLNVTRDTGEFLSVLVRATVARRVLEIGTSNGYSTLWLAEAARDMGGSVTSVDAVSHPEQLAPFVALVTADAGFTTSLAPVGKGEFLAVRALS